MGWNVTVITPSYGRFHTLPGARQLESVDIQYRSAPETIEVFDVPGECSAVSNIVLEHAGFDARRNHRIYSEDGPTRPFASDASKFALFGAAAAAWIDHLATPPDVIHLHDWHAAFYLLMRHYAENYEHLVGIRTVFTIHNLSYQGVRPLRDDESALESWFPGLRYNPAEVGDPVHVNCINPMAMAIRLADCVSTVSPTYAAEICRPSNPARGFIGGEGLEHLLAEARDNGRLVGILNGCFYDGPKGRRPGWQRLLGMIDDQLVEWPKEPSHDIARETLASLPKRRPRHVLTNIGRLVSQKASLFFARTPDGTAAIDELLDMLGRSGVLILLGSGETRFEDQMLDAAKRHSNLLFLRGYSETLAEPMYRGGDLFLMPSSFEPCGISQMLAMRAAQPCVVHGVGGLRDTVTDQRSGFVFHGETTEEQAGQFVQTVKHALQMKNDEHDRWQKICIRAASARFSWPAAARETVEQLYGHC